MSGVLPTTMTPTSELGGVASCAYALDATAANPKQTIALCGARGVRRPARGEKFPSP